MHVTRYADDHLTNADLAPVPLDRRTWNTWSFAALWISGVRLAQMRGGHA